MKKWMAGLMTAAFFLICLFPVWGRLLPGSDRAVETENRAMAQWPGRETKLNDWPRQVEDWFSDRLAYRREAVWLSNRVSGGGALQIVNNVLRGLDGFLFYMADGSEDDILRRTVLSGDQLEAIRAAQTETAQMVRDAGAEYILMVCPDKHTVYPEYLPEAMRSARGESRLDQAMKALEDIRVADARQALIGAKDQGILYYRTDTHWNELGA